MSKTTTPNFESTLKELETIVHDLEAGEMSLEESLSAFERGVKLTRECQSALEKAEQRVNLLIEKNGDVVSKPFDTSSVE